LAYSCVREEERILKSISKKINDRENEVSKLCASRANNNKITQLKIYGIYSICKNQPMLHSLREHDPSALIERMLKLFKS
jgi:hypothetical protein